MPAAAELIDRLRAETKTEMAKVAARYPKAKTMVREGPARTGILNVAREIGADLIVMGTHGRTGLAHIFFGSVAEYVVRHSHIPVLTVREEERSAGADQAFSHRQAACAPQGQLWPPLRAGAT